MRIRFGPFTLDLETRQLTSGGHEIHLEPKAFDLLSALVLERPKALSKADLQERLAQHNRRTTRSTSKSRDHRLLFAAAFPSKMKALAEKGFVIMEAAAEAIRRRVA